MKKIIVLALLIAVLPLGFTRIHVPNVTCAGFAGKPGQPSGIICRQP